MIISSKIAAKMGSRTSFPALGAFRTDHNPHQPQPKLQITKYKSQTKRLSKKRAGAVPQKDKKTNKKLKKKSA